LSDMKHDKWINNGKFTLFRNKEGNLMIYIRGLNEHDAGGYWIGVLYKWGIDMTLHVEEGQSFQDQNLADLFKACIKVFSFLMCKQ